MPEPSKTDTDYHIEQAQRELDLARSATSIEEADKHTVAALDHMRRASTSAATEQADRVVNQLPNADEGTN